MNDLVSRPYNPDSAKCCEACAFGRGKHADWCLIDELKAAITAYKQSNRVRIEFEPGELPDDVPLVYELTVQQAIEWAQQLGRMRRTVIRGLCSEPRRVLQFPANKPVDGNETQAQATPAGEGKETPGDR